VTRKIIPRKTYAKIKNRVMVAKKSTKPAKPAP
jgi:hypothetical protein